ncbi:MAG TPA: hypothetical protein VMO47_09175 [Rhodothermales bacterium]|nr:hypothetical protein [Rhodothermales bacterium]
MMPVYIKYIVGIALLVGLTVVSAGNARAQFLTTWLDIGDLHDKYSEVLGIRESPAALNYPAIHNRSDHSRAEAFWVGVKDWTDPSGVRYEYMTSKIGPRDPGADYAFPVENKLISKWEDTDVTVDGIASFNRIAVVSEVDPSLPADRVYEATSNMHVGVTAKIRAYAFSNAFHDEYHILDLTFTNTGNTDDDPDIELPNQTLNDAFFYYIHRWNGDTQQAARVGDNGQVWGKYNMLDVVGDGHAEYPVDFTAQYNWKGFEPGFTRWNNLGAPLLEQCCAAAQGDSVGRLAGGHMDGDMVIYAPNSVDDPTYNPLVQPHTLGFMDMDEKLTALGAAEREYYEDGILTRERQTRTPGVSPSRSWPHYADRIEPTGAFWAPKNDPSFGRQGGFSATQGFGPYNMKFGESVRIIKVHAVAGLDFDAQLYVGRRYKLSGADNELIIEYDANGDGVIQRGEYRFHDVYDLGIEALTKNQWAMSARDSLFKVFFTAREVVKAMGGTGNPPGQLTQYPIPQPPQAPRTFSVRGLPDRIALEWEPLDGGPARTGWEVYRTTRFSYWSPAWDNVRQPPGGQSLLEALEDPSLRLRRTEDELPYTCVAGNRPGCEQAALAANATSFEDTGVVRGVDYYYYLAALGAPQPVDPTGMNGTPGGVPLRSSRYYTQTYSAANLKRPPSAIEAARVVPNPVNLGSDQSLRFTKEDEVAFFNIPGECTIKIYTEVGELIQTIEHSDGSGDEKWNLTTASRQLLVSGIYIAVIETPEGERVFRKFTVIR